MQITLAALVVFVLSATPAAAGAVGFQRVTVPDSGDKPREVGIWYPSDAPAFPQPLGSHRQTVAPDGGLAGNRLPLIVVLHGVQGSFENHYDTALALAEAGFVVAAVAQSQEIHLVERPRHVARVLDYMLAAWAYHARVDPTRIGIIGWSHGGMITLLSVFRNPSTFRSAVAMVPVTNLFQRLAWKGVERQHQAIDPANRYGGLPAERHDVYKERSPLYNIDKLQIPLHVGVTRNDDDVNIEEDMQLVDALRSRKPALAETMVYDSPPGGHTFDRRVDPKTWQPENTREQRDSWNRVWTFLDWNLDPFHAELHTSTK